MFIHFCQVRKILPVIQQLDLKELSKWEGTNTQSLGSLIVDFFAYFAEFNWQENVISVRLGSAVTKGFPSFKSKTFKKGFCIEEPFDGSNTAYAVRGYKMVRIESTLKHCAKVCSYNCQS